MTDRTYKARRVLKRIGKRTYVAETICEKCGRKIEGKDLATCCSGCGVKLSWGAGGGC